MFHFTETNIRLFVAMPADLTLHVGRASMVAAPMGRTVRSARINGNGIPSDKPAAA
jgi:hypothetical protein